MAEAQTLFGSTRKHKIPMEDGTLRIDMAIPTGQNVPSGPITLRDFFKLTKLPLKQFYAYKKYLLMWLQAEIMKPESNKVIVGFEMEMYGDGDDHIFLKINPISKTMEEVIAEQEGRK